MCPVCIATAAWLAAGATSAGGVAAFAVSARRRRSSTALAIRQQRAKSGVPAEPPQTHIKEDRS
jgi:hypothetical protein